MATRSPRRPRCSTQTGHMPAHGSYALVSKPPGQRPGPLEAHIAATRFLSAIAAAPGVGERRGVRAQLGRTIPILSDVIANMRLAMPMRQQVGRTSTHLQRSHPSRRFVDNIGSTARSCAIVSVGAHLQSLTEALGGARQDVLHSSASGGNRQIIQMRAGGTRIDHSRQRRAPLHSAMSGGNTSMPRGRRAQRPAGWPLLRMCSPRGGSNRWRHRCGG